MSKTITIPGINIQWPWSDHIISGKKTVETRAYPLPSGYLNKELALIETPGKHKSIQTGIIGIIKFTTSNPYSSKAEWIKDRECHLVEADDPIFGYDNHKTKWRWTVEVIKKFKVKKPPPQARGIKFTKACKIKL